MAPGQFVLSVGSALVEYDISARERASRYFAAPRAERART
jgi:hypothetical protein